MLGHTNIRTTQLYAKILDEKVGSDMAPLREIFATGAAIDTNTSLLSTSVEIVQATDKKMSADAALLREKYQAAV